MAKVGDGELGSTNFQVTDADRAEMKSRVNYCPRRWNESARRNSLKPVSNPFNALYVAILTDKGSPADASATRAVTDFDGSTSLVTWM